MSDISPFDIKDLWPILGLTYTQARKLTRSTNRLAFEKFVEYDVFTKPITAEEIIESSYKYPAFVYIDIGQQWTVNGIENRVYVISLDEGNIIECLSIKCSHSHNFKSSGYFEVRDTELIDIKIGLNEFIEKLPIEEESIETDIMTIFDILDNRISYLGYDPNTTEDIKLKYLANHLSFELSLKLSFNLDDIQIYGLYTQYIYLVKQLGMDIEPIKLAYYRNYWESQDEVIKEKLFFMEEYKNLIYLVADIMNLHIDYRKK